MATPGTSNIVVNATEVDVKAEVIAAELVESGMAAEDIMILMLGSIKRSYRKDVELISDEVSDHNNKQYTQITTHREGLYDMLPQFLFHSPSLPKKGNSKKELLEGIKKHRSEEISSRRFFLPFEAAINHLRIQMALYENHIDKGASHNDLSEIFKQHWEIFKYLDANQANLFLQILPVIHEIRNNLEVTGELMQMFFSIPVDIYYEKQAPIKMDIPVLSGLNDTRLGIDFTTGNVFMPPGEEQVVIRLGPLNNEQLHLFRKGGNENKILEMLCNYLIDAQSEVVVIYDLKSECRQMILSDGKNNFNSTIGLSTYL